MWEKYYSTLEQLPRRLKQPVQFIVEALPTFKSYKIKSILDLGCGVGRNGIYLAKENFEVIGVDISLTALKIANKRSKKEKLRNIAFVQATMTNLPLSDSSLDAVISVSVIHHAVKKDIIKAIDEVYQVLKKNGFFLANLTSVKDPRYGTGQKIEDNTFLITEAFEEKRFEEIHHFSARREISKMFKHFSQVKAELLEDKPHYWKITAKK